MYKVVSCKILPWKCMFDVGTPVFHLTDVFAQAGRERLALLTHVGQTHHIFSTVPLCHAIPHEN